MTHSAVKQTESGREPVTKWAPYLHLDRACELADMVEQRRLGTADGIQAAIGLAQLHVAIATAKIARMDRA